MSDFFSEATVRVRPDLTGFQTQLTKDLREIIKKVEGTTATKVRISPALSRDFVGDLRRQVSAAVAQAQRGIKPIQIQAVVTGISPQAVQAAAATARPVQVPVTPAPVVTPTPAAPTPAAAVPREQLTGFARLAAVEKEIRAVTAAKKADATVTEKLSNEQKELNRLTRLHEEALLTEEGTRQRSRALSAAEVQSRRALNQLLKTGTIAQVEQASAMRQSIQRLIQVQDQNNATARSQARLAANARQLQRGFVATSLSFLGIRGATLAASISFLAGAASIAVFAKALEGASRFNDTLNVFQATTAATAEQLAAVRKQAVALGADISLPGVTAADAAEAMTELAKAGLSATESIAGARGVLQLATAAAIDTAAAVELAANALNAFELSGRQATHVADVFANAANEAQGSIVDIGIAFQQSAAAARQVGISFENTTVFLTALARAGLRGSDAGTSFRTAILRLINPSKKAQEVIDELGITLRDTQGNLRPDVFIQFAEATKNLTQEQRDQKLAIIGGQDAFRSLSILSRLSIKDFLALSRSINQQGTASKVAAARTKGLRGAVDALGSTLSTIGIRIGTSATPGLQGFVEGVTASVAGMAEGDRAAKLFQSSLEGLANVFTAIGAVALPVLGTLIPTLIDATNFIGIDAIIAGAAAWKTYGLAVAAVTKANKSLFLSQLLNVRSFRDFRGSIGSLASKLNLYAIAATAAAVAVIFLATRQSELERANKRLSDSLTDLHDVQLELAEAEESEASSQNAIGLARQRVAVAEQAVRAARAALSASDAAKGTFERTKVENALRIALDEQRNAQRNLNTEISNARVQHRNTVRLRGEEIAQASQLAGQLNDVAVAERRRAASTVAAARGGRGPGSIADPAAIAERRARVEQEASDRIVKSLLERARVEDALGDRDAQRRADAIRSVAFLADELDKVPTEKTFAIALDDRPLKTKLPELLHSLGVFGRDGEKALLQVASGKTAQTILSAWRKIFTDLDAIFNKSADDSFNAGGKIVSNLADGAESQRDKFLATMASIVAAANEELSALELQASKIVIAGGPGEDQALLANARAQAAASRKKAEALEKAGGDQDEINQAFEDAARDAADVRTKQDAIIQEQKQQAQKAEQAIKDAQEAQDKRDQAFIDLLGRRRARIERAIAEASTFGRTDQEIQLTQNLINLTKRQIAKIRERGKLTQQEIEAIRELQIRQQELQVERRKLILDRAAESSQLDIEFAQTTENKQAEIKFRQQEIVRLKRLQALTRRGSVEWKRYRNLIAEQREAINDVTKEAKEENKAIRGMFFEFMQRQTGFVARLLGNLIPIANISGIFGGGQGQPFGSQPGGGTGGARVPRGANIPTSSTGVGRAVARGARGAFPEGQPGVGRPGGIRGDAGGAPDKAVAAGVAAGTAAADAGKIQGPTRGQASTEIDLLRKILHVLRDIRASEQHPESKQQKSMSGAASSTTHDHGQNR